MGVCGSAREPEEMNKKRRKTIRRMKREWKKIKERIRIQKMYQEESRPREERKKGRKK